MGNGCSFPQVKQLGYEVGCTLLYVAEGKNQWSCNSISLVCVHGMGRDNFTFPGVKICIFCAFVAQSCPKENPRIGQDQKLLCAVRSKNEICIKSVWPDSNVPGDFKKGK